MQWDTCSDEKQYIRGDWFLDVLIIMQCLIFISFILYQI